MPNITGSIEYLLRVEAADLSSYKVFHTEVLGTLPQVMGLGVGGSVSGVSVIAV